MRKWIDLFESALTQAQMLEIARCWEGVTVTGDECLVRAADYVWEHYPNFPVADFDQMTHEDWCKWMSDEMEMWAEEGELNRYLDLLKDSAIHEEVVASYGHDGRLYIWDGYHRVGASNMVGRLTVPAIIGTPKSGS